ncbi:MAG: bifunctional 4-hydroxy-2-oxoglutarate aldolase/2-dehydro-3-deoxy-phosphogluconate aldolase [Christensenellales bacterium]|jgi:2-dehydro-3-deoxyphosphogluconate aldolase/(4S)-4-hydroxy-2-oxoglutarate aldolase
MNALKRIELCGIVPVIKLNSPDEALPLCQALENGGIDVAEITFRSDAATKAIALVRQNMPQMLVGAGTVTNLEQAQQAKDAGAQFMVTPGFSDKVTAFCQQHKIPLTPGCSSPTDMQSVLEAGLDVAKFFPAEASGGLKALKAISAPYHMLKFMPTGGIGPNNLVEYLSFNKVLACGGSWMVPDKLLKEKRFDEIQALTKEAVALLHGFSFHAIRLHSGDRKQAQKSADALCALLGLSQKENGSLLFAGDSIQLNCEGDGKGALVFACNHVERALYALQKKGVQAVSQSLSYPNNRLNGAALQANFLGYNIELTQR